MSDIGHREDTGTRARGDRRKGTQPLREVDWFPFLVFSGNGSGFLSLFFFCVLRNDTRDLEALSPCCDGADTLVSAKRVLPMGGFIILSSDMNHLYPLLFSISPL